MMGYGAGLGFGFGGWLAMAGGMLLVVGAIVLIAWAIAKTGQTGQSAQVQVPRPATSDALEILRTRFAKSEITADEYAAAKQVLEATR